MAKTSAHQFDGTLGSAKAICGWVGDESRAVYGASFGVEDDTAEAGLNLVATGAEGETIYETVNVGDWVVQRNGQHARLSDEQYQFVSN